MESDAVLDFKSNCNKLESGKVTERRTAGQRVYQLLERTDVVACLDEGSGGLTWDRLLGLVRQYVLKEAESGPTKARSGATSAAKRQEAVKLFKQVIRQADRHGPQLNCKEMFHHVLKIFRDDELCRSIGPDYASILLRDLLPVRRYYCEVTNKMWCEILEMVTGFLSKPPPSFDRNILARLLHLVVEQVSVQCGHSMKMIQIAMPFFAKVLQAPNDHVSILPEILGAFNTMAVASAMNIRGYLCELGEDSWSKLLAVLQKAQPSLRDQLLKFMLIQVRAHHPLGAHCEDSGGFAVKERTWKKNLSTLLEWVLFELEGENRRLKKKDSGRKPIFIVLMADVFYQVMLYQGDMLAAAGGMRVDFRNPTANWNLIQEMFSVNAVPWLQVAVTLLETYPSSMSDTDVLPTLEHLHQLQTDSKKLEPMQWTVRCLTVIVPIAKAASCASACSSVWKKVWLSAWRSVSVHHAEDQCFQLLTAIVEHKLIEPDYEPWQVFCTEGSCSPSPCAVQFLATYLQQYDLPDNLQLGIGLALPNPQAAAEQPEPGSAENVRAAYPLRYLLIQWLLGSLGSLSCVLQAASFVSSTFLPSTVPSASVGKTEGRRASAQLLATVLVALTHRSPSSCSALWSLLGKDSQKSKRLSVLEEDTSGSAESLEVFLADQHEIEMNYLQSTFDKESFILVKDQAEDDNNVGKCDGAFVASLQVFLCTALVKLCGAVHVPADAAEGSGNSTRERLVNLTSHLERECRLISLTTHIIRQLLLSGCMAIEDISDSPLLVHLTALSKSIAQGMCDSVLVDADSEMRCRYAGRMLSCLQPAFACLSAPPGLPAAHIPLIVGMCSLFQQGFMLDKLLQQLFLVSSNEWPQQRGLPSDRLTTPLRRNAGAAGNPSSPSIGHMSSMNLDATFDEDDDFDVESPVAGGMSEKSTWAPAQQNRETYLLHSSLLSSHARLAIHATRILCNWACACFLANSRGSSNPTVQSQAGSVPLSGSSASGAEDDGMMTSNAVCRHLFSWLEREKIDLSSAWKIQQTMAIIRELTTSSANLSADVLHLFLDCLRSVMSKHRRDQLVGAEVLRLVTLIAPHLKRLDSRQRLGQAHQRCIHLLTAFWGLYEDNLLSSAVKLELVALVEALLKVDPYLKWTEIKIKRRQERSEPEVIRLDTALCRLLEDNDHAVRIFCIPVIPRLFKVPATSLAWPRPCVVASARKKRHHDVPLHSSWDSCLVAIAREQHLQLFSQVEKAVERMCRVDLGNLPDNLEIEEQTNRVWSSLAMSGQLALSSLLCEKPALLRIFRNNANDEEGWAPKVLQLIQKLLGYATPSDFLREHTEFLLYQWLKQEDPGKFPHRLYGLPTIQDFFKKYSSEYVLHLLSRRDETELTNLGESLGCEWLELVEGNIGKFTTLTLPSFAAAAGTVTDGTPVDQDDADSQAAALADDFLREKLGKEAVDQLFTRQIDEFVVQLLRHVHISPSQPGEVSAFSCSTDPEPNPPVYTVSQAKATLKYMAQFHQGEPPTLLACLSRHRDCVQRILLALRLKVYHAHQSFQRRRFFLLYCVFVELIFRQAASSQAPICVFLLRDVVHTCVHLLQLLPPCKAGAAAAAENCITGRRRCQLLLVGACCHLLAVVCRSAVTSCVNELGKHLSLIVASLLPHANPSTASGKKALSLLDFLIRTNASPTLSECVASLDPLPDNHIFQRMREAQQDLAEGIQPSLASELKRFLSAGVGNLTHTRHDGLRHLHTMLLEAHDELKYLVSKNPALTGHASNGTESLVMRLIMDLKQLCETSKRPGPTEHARTPHTGLHLEIARCLGQLSTPDLHTVAMFTESANTDDAVCKKFVDNSTSYCIAVVLHRLSRLLVDPNVDVVSSASDCLKAVLATMPGKNFMATNEADLGSLVKYLEPFRPGRGKQRSSASHNSQLSGEGTAGVVDDDDLWLPWTSVPSVTHADWVCKLTCTVLQHAGIVDEVLLCLLPICRIKVEMAEAVLPFLVHHVLLQGGAQYTTLSRQARCFFAHCCRSFASPTSSTASSAAQSDASSSTSFAVRSTHSASALSGRTPSGGSFTLPPMQSMKAMLDTLAFLRGQGRQGRHSSRHAQPTVWDNNFWLDLDFFDVAATAQACHAPFTALLYIQIGCDAQRRSRASANAGSLAADVIVLDEGAQALMDQDLFAVPLSSYMPSNCRSLLLEAYTSIGEMDSLYGVGSDLLGNVQTRLCTYVQEGEWHKAIGAYNTQLMQNGPTTYNTAGLLQCLQQLGLEHVSSMYFDGLLSRNPDEAAQVSEFHYQAAWRSMQWDLPRNCSQQKDPGFHQSLHNSLRRLHSSDLASVESALTDMRVNVIHQLSETCLESTHSAYPILARLQSLVEVEEVWELLQGNLSLQFLGERWKSRLQLMTEDFSIVEPVLALRSSLLHVISDQQNFKPAAAGLLVANGDVPPCSDTMSRSRLVVSKLSETLESTARMSREAGQLQISERVLFNLQRLHEGPNKAMFVSTSHEWLWKLEYCRLFWARNEHRTALHMLRQLKDQLDKRQGNSESAAVLYPQVLCQYGQWLADTHNASPTTIMHDYMERAVDLMQCINDKAPTAAMEAYFAVARFADKQHSSLVQQMSSTEEESRVESIKKRGAELDQLSSASVRQGREVKIYMRLLQQQKETDSGYLQRFRDARNHFLLSSLKNYIRCLQAGDTYDLRIFRLISLWFENLLDKDVDLLMATELPRLQSRKLLPLIYQLAARISCQQTEGTNFQKTITQVIEKLCIDHPHHSLYVILALRNANEGTAKAPPADQPPPAKRLKRQTSSQPPASDDVGDDKISAAKLIVQRVARKRPTLVDSMCRLCDAYNELAYFNTQHLRGKNVTTQDISPQFKINAMRKLTEVAVTASNIEVDPDCAYQHLVTIEKFESHYTFCGGINMPKRIGCLGSDGARRQLLIKGQDDLRQDAVMQQVFEMVNQWLKRDPTTKKRQLQMRTYKVIPLSQRSGVVQWCVDTIPLGHYLVVGDQSAHRRYYPSSPTSTKCREAIANAGNNHAAKLKVYQDITKKFMPVFRYFFLENYPDPAQWFEHSLVYTRSAATSSIVGYIMGLGDRHCQNILIDQRTAEIIHIDLGVAFEQGKALPTPETIPFRLTRDIVDGMGLAGTEGVFRRCCEATLQLMKTSCEELITIVQVLLYDPLYQWTVSPVKARKLQADGSGTPQGTQTSTGAHLSNASSISASAESSSSRKMAEHVLKRLQQKLQGIEEEGIALSVSGQVAHLIQEATDEANLCRVFAGWQPWV